jgi:plastocyanin
MYAYPMTVKAPHRFRNAACVKALVALAFTLLAQAAAASDISVLVTDNKGLPVANAGVFIVYEGAGNIQKSESPAIMDQIDKEFVPDFLIVQKNTPVDFPNSDVVSHHVYSFSKPNEFELELYKGDQHSPQLFDVPGVVILGCNIHDNMLGYILIVDTPWFTKTNANGLATISGLPDKPLTLFAWAANSRFLKPIQVNEYPVNATNQTLEAELPFRHIEKNTDSNSGLIWKDY